MRMMMMGLGLLLGSSAGTAFAGATLRSKAEVGLAKAWHVSGGINYHLDNFKTTTASKSGVKSFTGTLRFSNGKVLKGLIDTKTGAVTDVETIKESR